jgi:hypothetical protein
MILSTWCVAKSDEVRIENGVINVYDTKTDKEIVWHAYSSDWVKPEKLLEPLGHLDACNGNIYSIKMSLYMFLIWKANRGRFKPGKLILNWCPIVRDEDGIPILKDGQPQIIKEVAVEVPYRKREVMAMLATRKTNT